MTAVKKNNTANYQTQQKIVSVKIRNKGIIEHRINTINGLFQKFIYFIGYSQDFDKVIYNRF